MTETPNVVGSLTERSPTRGDPTEQVGGYERSPADVLRFAAFALATVVAFALTRWGRDGIVGIEEDLLDLLSFLTPTWERLLVGVLQIVVVMALTLNQLLPLVTRRFRMWGYVLLGNVVAASVMTGLLALADVNDHPTVVNEIAARGGLDEAFPDPGATAALVAAFVVSAPFVPRRWRKAGAWLLTVALVLRFIVTAHLPVDVFLALGVGATVGAAILAVLGRPNTRPTVGAVGAALAVNGLDVAEIHAASVDARGSTPYFATLGDGTKIFAKVLGAEERSADLLFRIYRTLRFKDIGDERPFSSLRRTVEHEALVSLAARDVGVRTPRMRAVSMVGQDYMLLAYDRIDGTSMDDVSDADVDDGVLAGIWGQVQVLRRHRIAHRDLRRANLFLDDDAEAWIIDFGFSEVAADDLLLAADVAQLLASLAVMVGPDRAVGSAVSQIGPDAVASALPRLQMKTLSGATQTALKEQKGLLEELRTTAADRCGIEPPELEPVQRVDAKAVFTLVMLAAVTYFLVPQLADLPGVIGQIRDADWKWAIPTLVASAVTYLGATTSLFGSVPDRLPGGPTLLAQVGSSYASKLAPAGFGGMALNVRYLQRVGVDSAIATSAVGLNSVAGIVGHVVLLLLFMVWAGRSAFGSITLPDPHLFLYGIGAVAAVTVLAMAVPSVRRLVVDKLVPILRKAGSGLRDVITRPAKLFLLFGGSTIVSLSYIAAVYFASEAFGSTLSFAQVGAIYLAGSAVATAAPTPGGLGALEAALIAGFVAAGLDKDIAVPTVFFYRLATFWIPIIPGALSFGWLQRHEYL